LQVAGLRVADESLEHLGSLRAFTDFGIIMCCALEARTAQEPRRKHRRDGVDSLEGLISDLAHLDPS
jgi:hypothetical protein